MPPSTKYHQLVQDHRGIAYRVVIAAGVRRGGPLFDDLVQDALLGLVQAADKYDPERGPFSTFAWWYASSAVKHGLSASSVVHTPHRAVFTALARGERAHAPETSTTEWDDVPSDGYRMATPSSLLDTDTEARLLEANEQGLISDAVIASLGAQHADAVRWLLSSREPSAAAYGRAIGVARQTAERRLREATAELAHILRCEAIGRRHW
jgi:RNA polymerase sigma factor (sigma-70 family)